MVSSRCVPPVPVWSPMSHVASTASVGSPASYCEEVASRVGRMIIRRASRGARVRTPDDQAAHGSPSPNRLGATVDEVIRALLDTPGTRWVRSLASDRGIGSAD